MLRLPVLLLCLLVSGMSVSQSRIDFLKSDLNNKHGKDKLLVLHQLTDEYLVEGEIRRSLKYAKQAQHLADAIIKAENDLITPSDLSLKPLTYLWLGKVQFEKKDYYDAKKTFEKASQQAIELDATELAEEARTYLSKLDSIVDEKPDSFVSALKELDVGGLFSSSATDINITASLKLARAYEKKENYPKAIEQYQKAIELLRDKGDSEQISELKLKIAGLYEKSGLLEEALDQYKEVKESALKSVGADEQSLTADARDSVATTTNSVPELTPKKITSFYDAVVAEKELKSQNLQKIAADYEEQKDYEKSLSYYKLYLEANQKMEADEHLRELEMLEIENQMENQTNQITLLQQEKELQNLKLAQNESELAKQTMFRNNLILGSLVMFSFVLAFYSLYKKKKKSHLELQVAYDDLNSTKQKLSQAEKSIKTLLQQQVSGPVADELLSGHTDNRISKRFVCIMFLDIRNFTPYAEGKDPEEIIQYQNDLFAFMIDIIHQNHGIVNQFLGDGFMATFGAPTSVGNDCDNAYNSALRILQELKLKNEAGKIHKTKVGIGLHAGRVVTGNVGTKERKQYSITGNTVILASRIEQLNKKYGTQLLYSGEVFEHLSSKSKIEDGYTEETVKGRSTPIRIYQSKANCQDENTSSPLGIDSKDQLNQVI